MPIKILLADKSITIQKVVEMLFSGRDYDVVSLSDGETGLKEATRIVPDVVLVDVDLPRIDGYSFAARMKQTPLLAQTPVILMMSRDDVYDTIKGAQAGIVDNIAKPFESQELIGKVKKAIAAASPRRPEPASSTARPPAASEPPLRPAPPVTPAAPLKPKKDAFPDIFDIISEAPTQADLARAAASGDEESVYEVEPVVEEVDEPLSRDVAKSLPVGAKAMEEMRAGLGLNKEKEKTQPEHATYESFNIDLQEDQQASSGPKAPIYPTPGSAPSPVQPSILPEAQLRKMAEEAMARMAKEVFANLPPVQLPQISDETLRAMVNEKVERMTKEALEKMPPQPPPVSRESLRAMVAEEVSSKTNTAPDRSSAVQPSGLTSSDVWSAAEDAVRKIAQGYFDKQFSPQSPQISDETLRAMVAEKISAMTKEISDLPPAAQTSALSASDMWSVADEAVQRVAREFFEKQPSMKASLGSDETLRIMVEEVAAKTVEEALEKKAVSHPPSMPPSELRKMAEETVSRMALEIFSDMTPPIPKISEDTVRRGIEEAVMKIARDVAREVIEKVAWETVPQLAEVMIKEEIERLKAME
jgi:CheY-like chemotaxis protein